MRRQHARRGVVLALLLALSGLSACTTDDGASDAEAGALAVARAYLDAIADRDLETAEAMAGPAAFDFADGPDANVDVRAALPEAQETITDPWVALVSPTNESRYGSTEFVVDVSYRLGELTGGGTIVVRLEPGEDPGEVANWTVTAPLIVRGPTHVNSRVLSSARLGPVRLTYIEGGYRGVWGYPGGYLLEAEDREAGIEPLPVRLGVADAPSWDELLPQLGGSID